MSKLISVGQIIDGAWTHYTKHFQSLMKISLWFFLIPLLMLIATILTPVEDLATLLDNQLITVGNIIGLVIGGLATLVVSPIVGIWIFLNLVQAIDRQASGKKVNFKTTNRAAWKLFFPYIWAAVLKGLVILLPLLLILPGLILIFTNVEIEGGVFLGALSLLLTFLGVVAAFLLVAKFGIELSFVEFELVLNRKRGVQTLKGSRAIVKGRWWQVLWRFLLPTAVFSFGVLIAELVLVLFYTLLLAALTTLGEAAVVRIDAIAQSIITFGMAAVSTPLFVIVGYLIYDSLRKTK
ncbi:hypothetical protein IH979_02595 [Patescibacteria group bacterium]|nr:hypothetical protein [Patescibacteria group bacterium]